MAKLESQHKLDNTILSYSVKDSESGENFSTSVDLATIFPGVNLSSPLLLAALAFALRTALRNATGGREIDEAEEAVAARVKAWQNGEWGAERISGEGLPFTQGHILVKAVARVYSERFPTPAAACDALNAMLAAQLAAQQDAPSWGDLSEDDQRKARNAFASAARKDAQVDLAVTTIQAEQAAARAAKKAADKKADGPRLF